ncbi:hypothetical protein [Streptomyces sp. NPDC001348]
MDEARTEWAKAVDADVFYAHYDKGFELIDPDRTVTACKALGLATAPPSSDDTGLEVWQAL